MTIVVLTDRGICNVDCTVSTPELKVKKCKNCMKVIVLLVFNTYMGWVIARAKSDFQELLTAAPGTESLQHDVMMWNPIKIMTEINLN